MGNQIISLPEKKREFFAKFAKINSPSQEWEWIAELVLDAHAQAYTRGRADVVKEVKDIKKGEGYRRGYTSAHNELSAQIVKDLQSAIETKYLSDFPHNLEDEIKKLIAKYSKWIGWKIKYMDKEEFDNEFKLCICKAEEAKLGKYAVGEWICPKHGSMCQR